MTKCTLAKVSVLSNKNIGYFMPSHPYLPPVPVYDKIAATDAGGASEHRTVSVGPVQASARTTICNSGQEGE